MAIAVDASTSFESNQSSATGWSFSHTCTGTNLVLVVLTCSYFGQVTSVSYGGNALTQAVSKFCTTPGFGYSQIWYLIAPPTGSNTVSFNVGGGQFGGDACAISFTGADQTNPVDGTNSDTNTTGTASLSVTTSASSTYVVDCLLVEGRGGTATATVGGSQTQFYFTNTQQRGGEKQVRAGSYRQASSPTMTWTSITTSAGGGWAYTAMGIKQAPIVTALPTKLLLLGIGGN